MKLSSRERTGLRAMAEFARRYGDGPISLSEVARAQDLHLPYLERVAASLRKSGLLHSVRGAHGGYLLTRAPSAVSVGDVFRAVEGEIMPLDCMRADGVGCARESFCATRNVWHIVATRLGETLDGTFLADILQS